MDKVKQYLYYFVIGIVSVVALVFLPMVGSEVGLGFRLPDTAAGWFVWISTRIIVAVLNVLIFHCFLCQAKLNVQEDENFKEANKILEKTQDKVLKDPRSPHKWMTQQYATKGVSIFVSTALASIALTQAVLTFDYVTMLTYLFTIIMGLVFGVISMKSAEFYWTDEYVRYAYYIEHKNNMEGEKEE